MNSAPEIDRTRVPSRRRALLIFALLFISYGYFYQAGGWNQNSRFDMVRALLEQGTLRIDDYHENTEDKTLFAGHYYSDKAPGLALLALPAAWTTRAVMHGVGKDPASAAALVTTSYIATVFAVALPSALACVCLFFITLRLTGSLDAAAFAALAMGLATPIWPWSTLFWGHALAGACLVFAFAAAWRVGQSEKGLLWLGLAAGLAAGWATVSEYPAAPATVMIAAFAIAQAWHREWKERWLVAVGIAVGAGACLVVLLSYQQAAFGSLLRPSYTYYQAGAFPWMQRGYMGLTYPHPDVMLKLLSGCRRGLLFAAPVLLAAPFGFCRLYTQRRNRAAAMAAAAIASYYFLFNASFSSWPGGWSYGPRYMAAGVPLLCVGLAAAWANAGRVWRKALIALAACGMLFSLMAASVTAQPPDEFRCPLFQLLWPSFWSGKLSLTQGSMLKVTEGVGERHGAFNLGELLGLRGLMSLVPLLICWASIAAMWVWIDHRERRQSCVRAASG